MSPTKATGRCWSFPLERPRQEKRMATTNSAVQPVESLTQPARRRRGWNPFRFRDQPFFDDKNRAFWILQSAGWTGYFVLRTLSGIGNAKDWGYVLHTALLTAT